MSRDLKDLIDTVEKETRSHAELEQIISSLKEEINKFKFTVKEQKFLIESLKTQLGDEQIERVVLPSEIDILKDIISSQRQELNEKQSDIEKLYDRIDNLATSMEINEDISDLEIRNKDLLENQMQIVQLSNENQEYRHQIKFLKDQIEELRLEKSEVKELIEEIDEEPEVNEELINVKRLNFQLMEENGLLRLEVESLKTKFQENLERAISEELKSAQERNAVLSSKFESLKNKLHEHIETSSEELESAQERNAILSAELESLKAKLQEREDSSSEELESAQEKNAILLAELEFLKAKLQEREDSSSEELESAQEKNAILLAEMESLKAKLQERGDIGKEELKLANDKISILTAELADYKAQVDYLKVQLEDIHEPIIVTTEDALEFAEMREKFENLKIELSNYQIENQNLNKMLKQSKEKEVDIKNEQIYEPEILKNIPKQLQLPLFNRIYHLLDKNNKEIVINLLIQDLKSNNSEIKRNAIKILSHIRYKKVYDALLELINDKDWIVRYNIIKALSKFEKKNEEFTSFLKKLTKDVDVDVRELATKILSDIT